MTEQKDSLAQCDSVRVAPERICDIENLATVIKDAREAWLDKVYENSAEADKLRAALMEILWNNKGTFPALLTELADRRRADIRTPAACEQPDIDALAQFIRDAEREHGQCDDDDTYISYRQTARAILQKFDVRPKHSSTERQDG